MSPPTEQLIRDYLKRLSVAARGRLNREEKRALIERTRGHIEQNTGLSGSMTEREVAGLLTRLGDPALAVAHEVQRLAERHGDAGEPPPAPRISRLSRAIRREPGRLGVSWHWPARPGSLADLHAVLTGGQAGAADSNAAPEETDVGAREITERGAGPREAPVSGLEALGLVGRREDDAAGATGPPGNAGPGGLIPAAPDALAGLIPAQPGGSESLNGMLPGVAGPGRFAGVWGRGAAARQRPRWPHDPAIRRETAQPGQAGQDAEDQAAVEAEDQAAVQAEDQAAAQAELPAVSAAESAAGADAHAEPDITELSADDTGELPAVELTAVEQEATGAPRLAWLRPAWAAVVGWTRDKTLESVATILLGLGGAIFPPVWLLGAVVALASRVWDYRDKWVGLAIPIVLTIVGTATGLILTGSQSSLSHDLHVAWVSANISSRVSAVLGATYLAWRSVRGKRPDAMPPWNKAHRIG